jgi:hypothetical protein
MNRSASAVTDIPGVSELLLASGPDPEHEAELMLYGRLVGSWDIDARYLDADGNETGKVRGEWHFGWGLNGRAIVDVLISPPITERQEGQRFHEYGTTVRVYDPALKAWRCTWNPTGSSGTIILIARPDGDDIVMEGRAREGHLERWTFSEITEDFFLWQGLRSDDEGETWVLTEEMRATRRRE